MLDLKRATLGAYEEGRSNPKMETVIKIANRFNVDLEDLLTGELTINKLLRFNEAITTVPPKSSNEFFPAVPCVTQELRADFLRATASGERISLPTISLPFVTGPSKVAFVVSGDVFSGSVKILSRNDTVIAQVMESQLIPQLRETLVVLATAEGIAIGRGSFADGNVSLLTNDSGTDPVSVPQEKIIGVWKVAHVFHLSLPDQDQVQDRLSRLESAVEAMLAKGGPSA